MNIVTENNADVVFKRVKKIFYPSNLEKALYGAASDLRNMIEARTKKGEGLRGDFKEYSTKKYYRSVKLRPKAKGGKPSKTKKSIIYEGGYRQFAALTKGSETPNLFASGNMFRAMQAQAVSAIKSQIGFLKREEAKKALINNEERPFFGVTREELLKLNGYFNAYFGRLIRLAGFN